MIFGTDGIRARMGEAPLDQTTITKLSRVLRESLGPEATLVLGTDTRASCIDLRAWITSHLGGLFIHDLGIVPTPVVAFETRARGADLGIMITASHNPAEDNGLKFFDRRGLKLDTQQARAWSDRVAAMPLVKSEHPPQTTTCGADHYLSFVGKHFKPEDFQGLRAVFDLAHGAATHLAPELIRMLAIDAETMGAEPNGHNINQGCGALHPKALSARLRESGRTLGFALDGDGDRLVVCAPDPLPGDVVLYAMLEAYGIDRPLPKALVGTIMCNKGLEDALAERGILLVRTDVGDQHVLAEMVEKGHHLGGEPSGHLIQADLFPAGDGLLAALRLARGLKYRPDLIEQARRAVPIYPHYENALPVRHKPLLESQALVHASLSQLQAQAPYPDRVIVRYSGTEPKLRIYVEAPDLEPLKSAIAALEAAVAEELA